MVNIRNRGNSLELAGAALKPETTTHFEPVKGEYVVMSESGSSRNTPETTRPACVLQADSVFGCGCGRGTVLRDPRT